MMCLIVQMKMRVEFLKTSGRLKRWSKDERGSYTLEAAIVLPTLFAMVLVFLIFGMYLYQKTVVYYAAAVTSERAAFSWDNSHRDPKTGMLLEPQYDGLYRHLGSDGALASLFGLDGKEEERTIEIPEEADESGAGEKTDFAVKKLVKASGWMSTASLPYDGAARYVGNGLSRLVEVKLRKPIQLLPWERSLIRGEPGASADGYVVDPVEFVRSVELVRYYSAKLSQYPMGRTTAKSRANEVLASYGQNTK